MLLFFIKKLLNTDCHQTDYQTHERDKHYAEDEADIKTPSPDEITQAEMIHRVIIKIGPIFPHHDINHDANKMRRNRATIRIACSSLANDSIILFMVQR